MESGQLILRKIVKLVATRCQILRLMHQNRFWLGICPRPRWGNSQRSPDPVDGKGRDAARERKEREEKAGIGDRRRGEKVEGMGKGRRWRDPLCIITFSLEQPMHCRPTLSVVILASDHVGRHFKADKMTSKCRPTLSANNDGSCDAAVSH